MPLISLTHRRHRPECRHDPLRPLFSRRRSRERQATRSRTSWSAPRCCGVTFTRRGSISPPRDPSRVPRSFGRAHPQAYTLTSRELPHGQSILEVLRTKPLTAPAPGSDRRLSDEGHQVGGHRARSGHEQASVHSVRRWRPGARPGMHLRRQGTHLYAHHLHHLRRHRTQQAVTGSTKRCILEVWTVRRRQRPGEMRHLPAAADARPASARSG